MLVFDGVVSIFDGDMLRLEMETNKIVEDAKKQAVLIVEKAKEDVKKTVERAPKHVKNTRGRVIFQRRCKEIGKEVNSLATYIYQHGNARSHYQAKEMALVQIKKRNQEIHQETYGK